MYICLLWLICNWQWAPSSRKSPTSRERGRGEDIGYFKKEKNCGLFRFVTPEIPDKMKLCPSALEKLLHRMELPGPKSKTFFNTPGNANFFFFFFFFDLWSFCSIIFQYTPKKFQVFNPPPPPVWNFFRSSSSCHASIIVI